MIAWSEHYLMGVEELDRDHQQIFTIADKILGQLKSRDKDPATRMFVVREGLNYLHGYFARHAAKEEAYMKKIGYERYALHKMQHDDFQKNQLVKYQKIVDSGECTKEDAWDFIGNGIGWLLEHIATSDMDIVGKGVLQEQFQSNTDITTLENKINMLFLATLNLEAHAKVINKSYMGEPFGNAVYQKIVYEHDGQEVNVVSGIETSFILLVARMLYGDDVEDEMSLILSTVEIFGARFWISFYRQLSEDYSKINIKENRFLVRKAMLEEIQQMDTTISLLFTSDNGKFFLVSDTKMLSISGITDQQKTL